MRKVLSLFIVFGSLTNCSWNTVKREIAAETTAQDFNPTWSDHLQQKAFTLNFSGRLKISSNEELCLPCLGLKGNRQPRRGYSICIQGSQEGQSQPQSSRPSGFFDLVGVRKGQKKSVSDTLIFTNGSQNIQVRAERTRSGSDGLRIDSDATTGSESQYLPPQTLKKCMGRNLTNPDWNTLLENQRFSLKMRKDVEIQNGFHCFPCAKFKGVKQAPELCFVGDTGASREDVFDLHEFRDGGAWRNGTLKFKNRTSNEEIELWMFVKSKTLGVPLRAPDKFAKPQLVEQCLLENDLASRTSSPGANSADQATDLSSPDQGKITQ